jgi:S1-C subfamily serine protease
MNHLYLSIVPILGSLLILPTAIAFTPNKASNSPHSIQLASNLSNIQIRQIAQTVTIKVLTNKELGSGVLIAKQGTTYTVLTNAHVLNAKGKYRIQTPDGLIHAAVVANKGSSLQGNDLAVLQFSSKQTYRIVALATTTTTKSENQSVYAAGFPIDSQQLLITTGKISIIAPKPLLGGYQLGYTNEIKQGMSGGPLLNQSGELIGVNGLLNAAILNDTYTYLDGSTPSNELRQQLQKVSFAVPIQTLAIVAPQLAVIPPQWRRGNSNEPSRVAKQPTNIGLVGEIDLIAQQITLRIDSKNNGNGSGIIMARQGQTYYVLTNFHVVENPDQYTVVTGCVAKNGRVK